MLHYPGSDALLVEDCFLTIGSGCLKDRWSGRIMRGGPLAAWLLRHRHASVETVVLALLGPGDRFLRTDEIRLTPTRPHFGGVRWWFRCPGCGRRCGKLHVPRVGDGPGCRRCHGLRYRQCVEHDRRVDDLVKHPERLRALLARLGTGAEGLGPMPRPGDMAMAMKAVERLVEMGRLRG